MSWVDWSRAVIDQLIDDLSVCNGDAQAIFESMPRVALQCYREGYTAEQAARVIDECTKVH